MFTVLLVQSLLHLLRTPVVQNIFSRKSRFPFSSLYLFTPILVVHRVHYKNFKSWKFCDIIFFVYFCKMWNIVLVAFVTDYNRSWWTTQNFSEAASFCRWILLSDDYYGMKSIYVEFVRLCFLSFVKAWANCLLPINTCLMYPAS